MVLGFGGPRDDIEDMKSPLSTTSDQGCGECGHTPSYLTPDGFRCQKHIPSEDEDGDWLPLSRKPTSTTPPPSGWARPDAT